MNGNKKRKLDSLQSKNVVTAADIERVVGKQCTADLVLAFVDLCRRSERKSWKVKALHFAKDDWMTEDDRLKPGLEYRMIEADRLSWWPGWWTGCWMIKSDPYKYWTATDGEVEDDEFKNWVTPADGRFKDLVELFEEGYLNDIEDLRFDVGEPHGLGQQSMERFCKLIQSGRLNKLRILHFDVRFQLQTTYKTFWKVFANLLSSNQLKEVVIIHKLIEPSDVAPTLLANQFASGHLVSLRVLSLQGIYIGDEELGCLDEAFRSGHASELECLKLGSNGLGEAGARSLADALGSGFLRSLRVLHFSSNRLGDKGVVSLARSFHAGHSSNLECLGFAWDSFREVGARALAEALGSGHLGSLRILDLHCNLLGDEAVMALADALQTGCATKLEALRLDANDIGDKGMKSLAATFECGKCPKLISLDLKRNNVSIQGMLALVKAFKSGHLCDLETVHLNHWAGWETLKVKIVEIAGALEAGSLPRLQVINLFEASSDFIQSPLVVKDALENSYRRNPYLIARFWGEDDTRRDPWLDRLKNLRRSNQERVDRLKLLQNEDVVGQHGKVFFCGDPLVGKTTLKITLSANKELSHLLSRYSQGPEPTRGIEVTNVQSEGVTLALWDLAGQHDYEVLHSAFLPDLNFAGGQATFFVIVCKAHTFDEGKKQLEYWMRFISSNSVKDVNVDRRRRVFVVLNWFHDHPVAGDEILKWKNFLTGCEKGFRMYLNLCKNPFIMDATSEMEVQSFKSTILEEAKKMLQSRKMPQICLSLQEQGREWLESQKNTNYPVLMWHQYRVNIGGNGLVQEIKLYAAAEYLHEAGHIILFRQAIPSSGLESEVLRSQKGLVIVDPEWFCKQVVGNLLLPEDIESQCQVENKVEILQEKEGALVLISALSKDEFRVPPDKIDETVMILSRLGICYQIEGRAEHIFVPALIKEEGMPGWSAGSWECGSGTGAWVMGFSVRVEDLTATLLPIIVLRKLQVNLALDKSIGERQDRSYLARKFSISFKFNGVDVFIEYSSKKQDRIDVLVRPFAENVSRDQQIEVAQGFVNRITETIHNCARGVELDRRIIKPWDVSEGWKPMEQRDIRITVASLISRLEENGIPQMMEWTVEGKQVSVDGVLSAEDLPRRLLHTTYLKVELTKQALDCLSGSNLEKLAKGEGASSIPKTSSIDIPVATFKHRDADLEAVIKGVCLHVEKLVGQVLSNERDMERRLHEHISQLGDDEKGNINKLLEEQRLLNLQIQNLERFSVDEIERSVPRFAYVTKKGASKWSRQFRERLAETVVLRFLCEAKYDTGAKDKIGTIHEVAYKDQRGIKVTKIPNWEKKLLPVLVWTLKIAFVASKIVGNAILPGLGLLFVGDAELSRIFDKITQLGSGGAELSKYLFEQLDALVLKQSLPSTLGKSIYGGSSSSSWVPGTEREIKGVAKEALRNAINEIKDPKKRMEKVGLRRVWLESSDPANKRYIVYICNKCYESYTSHNPPIAHDV